jgi:hypothetical protein
MLMALHSLYLYFNQKYSRKRYILAVIFFVFIPSLKAQPSYSKLRAGFTLEGLGIAPVGMFSAELPILYNSKGFWNVQAGVGITGSPSAYSPSFSTAVTYNFLLNSYHKNLCKPAPGFNKFESYLETGIATLIFNAQYGGIPSHLYTDSHFRPAGIMGVRLHFVKERWIYILKIRLTPFLDKQFSVWGGAGIGLGWK